MFQLPIRCHQTQQTRKALFFRRRRGALLGKALDCGSHISAFGQSASVERRECCLRGSKRFQEIRMKQRITNLQALNPCVQDGASPLQGLSCTHALQLRRCFLNHVARCSNLRFHARDFFTRCHGQKSAACGLMAAIRMCRMREEVV